MIQVVKTDSLKTRPPFLNLFPVVPENVMAITEVMKKTGFDQSKPIDTWQGFVVDGHTRLESAKKAGLDRVLIFDHNFANEDEALAYAIYNQRVRRNIDLARILECVAALDRPGPRGGDYTSEKGELSLPGDLAPGDSAETTASLLGVSRASVTRARVINEYGDDEVKEAVRKGEKPLREAYQETQEKRAIERERTEPKPTFNQTNDNIEWASWSWNPVTGCNHKCEYCYARDIANHYFPEKFKPTFHPERLTAPKNTKFPKTAATNIGDRSVFVCSMADLFGSWIPKEQIEAVIKATADAQQWNFLFLTKNPERYLEFNFPKNAWLGTTVDVQSRVEKAVEVFSKIKATVKFLSCEPMLEKLTFSNKLRVFDWVLIGGGTKSTKTPANQPEWSWVEDLLGQARAAGCMVYFKPNLEVRPREYPTK